MEENNKELNNSLPKGKLDQALVQRMDSFIWWITHLALVELIWLIVIYPLDLIHPLIQSLKKKKQPERRDTSVPQNASAHMPLVPLNWKVTNKTFCQILLLCFYESNGFRDIKLNRGPNGSNELYSTSPKRSHYVTLVDRFAENPVCCLTTVLFSYLGDLLVSLK